MGRGPHLPQSPESLRGGRLSSLHASMKPETQQTITFTWPCVAYSIILLSRVTMGIWWCLAVAMTNLSAGSPCKGSGRCEDAIAISGSSGASLMPGPAMNRANQLCGSGRKDRAGPLPPRTRLNNPTSQADAGDTNTPSASAACEMAASASWASGSPLASHMIAHVSSRTTFGNSNGLFVVITRATSLRLHPVAHQVQVRGGQTLRECSRSQT